MNEGADRRHFLMSKSYLFLVVIFNIVWILVCELGSRLICINFYATFSKLIRIVRADPQFW